jgi:hypothetical protein
VRQVRRLGGGAYSKQVALDKQQLQADQFGARFWAACRAANRVEMSTVVKQQPASCHCMLR